MLYVMVDSTSPDRSSPTSNPKFSFVVVCIGSSFIAKPESKPRAEIPTIVFQSTLKLPAKPR